MTPNQRRYTLAQISPLLGGLTSNFDVLEFPEVKLPDLQNEVIPPTFKMVKLPDWAVGLCPNGEVLVPTCSIGGSAIHHSSVDWLAACFWFLTARAERAYEEQNGSIHSYAFRLRGWDSRHWKHPWVNYIALFLRHSLLKKLDLAEQSLTQPLPKPELIMTHDVDAVKKTIPIRFKQATFLGINSILLMCKGQIFLAFKKIIESLHFLVSKDNYWCFPEHLNAEDELGIRSIFNFYGGGAANITSWQKWLMDPGYDVAHPKISTLIKELDSKNWEIGLHQSYFSWESADQMRAEKEHLERAGGLRVKTCRQHWLRFAFSKTWLAQEKAGFELDMTVGFNDRPGFRLGAALEISPWNQKTKKAMKIRVVPMILMDSHLHDYQNLSEQHQKEEIQNWCQLIRRSHGKASVIWHQRTISKDYGWKVSWKAVLKEVSHDRQPVSE